MKLLPKTLLAPKKPQHLSKHALWLAGEGAGSWFEIKNDGEQFVIERFSPEGHLECGGYFYTQEGFDIKSDYGITYPSHCQKVTLIQNDRIIQFKRLQL